MHFLFKIIKISTLQVRKMRWQNQQIDNFSGSKVAEGVTQPGAIYILTHLQGLRGGLGHQPGLSF
jgi:hypothetical protein